MLVEFYRGIGKSIEVYASRTLDQVPRKGDEIVFAKACGTVRVVHWVFAKHPSLGVTPFVKVYFS